MNMQQIIDIIISVLFDGVYHNAIYCAHIYKKSKTRVKKEKMALPRWRRVLGIYLPSNSHAPRNMRLFFRIRLVHICLFLLSQIVFLMELVFPEVLPVLYALWGFTLILIYCPTFIYLNYLYLRRGVRQRVITFEMFKNP